MVKVGKKEVVNKTTFKISNWNKITPKCWKRIGDVCIYSLPLLQGVIMQSPFSSDTKIWINFILGIFLVGSKMITKFFSQEKKL